MQLHRSQSRLKFELDRGFDLNFLKNSRNILHWKIPKKKMYLHCEIRSPLTVEWKEVDEKSQSLVGRCVDCKTCRLLPWQGDLHCQPSKPGQSLASVQSTHDKITNTKENTFTAHLIFCATGTSGGADGGREVH